MLERAAYLEKIKSIKDYSRTKIIAGIRHSGKSFLLYQIISELKLSGVDDEHIIHINFESSAFDIPKTADEIESFIHEKTANDDKYYLFFDEIQTVSGWEKAVSALSQQRELDVYITMSDAAPLSKLESQREKYVIINFKPFSFSEYKRFFAPEEKAGDGLLNRAVSLKNPDDNSFIGYMRYGGFPAVYTGLRDSYSGLSVVTDEDTETMTTMLNGIYSSILLRDIIQRAKIRNIELLEQIINIIFSNIGKENSTSGITESLRQKHYTKNLSLVPTYIKALENAFVIKRIYRYNLLKGGSSRSNAVYFVGDHSLLNAVIGTADEFSPKILENVLVHDLERRGYTVYTGKFDDRHIDFAAEQDDAFIFLQTISQKTDDETILEQKTESLVCLNDDEKFATQKKYVIFLDVDDSFVSETGASTGINYLSLQDFLLTE